MKKKFVLKQVTALAAALGICLSSCLVSYASEWQQDTNGWKIQNEDGTYLSNAWYQSPESGIWYYVGAEGYMLVNTTTPDGYTVNADGAYVETADYTLDSWKNDFRNNWWSAYKKVSDEALIATPNDWGTIRFSFTMPFPDKIRQEFSNQMMHDLCKDTSGNFVINDRNYYLYNWHVENGTITMKVIHSTEPIAKDALEQ